MRPKNHTQNDNWGWFERLIAALIVVCVVCLILVVSALIADAAPVNGNGSSCAPENYWTDVKCTVKSAGKGWVFGNCELSKSFSGTTKLTLASGDKVWVSGCENQYGNLYSAGRRYPLVIRKR